YTDRKRRVIKWKFWGLSSAFFSLSYCPWLISAAATFCHFWLLLSGVDRTNGRSWPSTCSWVGSHRHGLALLFWPYGMTASSLSGKSDTSALTEPRLSARSSKRTWGTAAVHAAIVRTDVVATNASRYHPG